MNVTQLEATPTPTQNSQIPNPYLNNLIKSVIIILRIREYLRWDGQ